MFFENNLLGILLGIVFFGIVWLFGYRKGRLDVIRAIEDECKNIDIEDLKRKLAEQNRINEMNRNRI